VRVPVLARFAGREARGAAGRLSFFVACLAVGVAAVTAVSGLTAAVDAGVRGEARTLLAADLAVSGSRPPGAALDRVLERIPGAQRSDVRELLTVVAAETPGAGGSQLVSLKAVESGYPFYGSLRIEPRDGFDPADPRAAAVAPELAERLDLAIGDELLVGGHGFRVAGLVQAEPDRLGVRLGLAPRVLVGAAGLDRTGLETFGSRVEYRALVRLPEDVDATAVAGAVREALPDAAYLQIETWSDAQPNLRNGLRRVERYLALVALLSLLVGGVGVGLAVRSFLATRMEALAVLRCLGLTAPAAASVYLGEALVLGALGGLAGVAAATALLAAAPGVAGGVLRAELIDPWQPGAVLRGLALALAVTLLFAWEPLVAAARVPVARVFRRDAEPLAPSRGGRWLTAAVLAAGVTGLGALQARSWSWGVAFTAGLLAIVGVLQAGAWALTRLSVLRTRFRLPPALRHALAALGRPGAGVLGAVVALGLGITLVLGLLLIERRLVAQLDAEVPADAPSAFLVDIRPSDWPAVRDLLVEQGAVGVRSVPMVVARLREVDGRPVDQILAGSENDGDSRRWALTREQRITYLDELPDDNRIVAGALWSEPERPEVSIETGFAHEIGARLGSTLLLDVQGVSIALAVTSLREVEWRTFGINFFLVAEPSALEAAPQMRVATARLPPGRELAVQDLLARRFPGVTVLRVGEILDRVANLLERLALGVRLLGGFAVLAGLAILGGAISASSVRRTQEVALLKALGMSRRGVIAALGCEYALLGVVAGLIGVAAGAVLAYFVTTRGLDLPWQLDWGECLALFAASVALAVAGGLVASLRALRARPAALLEEG
jgi:putative ABC transport system permease protein